MSVFSNICRDVDIWGREGVIPPTEKTAHFAGQLNLFQGNNDTKESCHVYIPVHTMVRTNFRSAH